MTSTGRSSGPDVHGQVVDDIDALDRAHTADMLHASGVRYAWVRDRQPEIADLAPLPAWVLRQATEQPGRLGHPIAHWRRLVREGVREGERNNTIASLAGHLLRHSVDAPVVMEVLLCWNRVRCQPPLVDDEVVSVVESIRRLHARENRSRNHGR